MKYSMKGRVKPLCAALGKNMKWLAADIGVTHQTVMYWNQGRANPPLNVIAYLLTVFGCTFWDLVGVEEY